VRTIEIQYRTVYNVRKPKQRDMPIDLRFVTKYKNTRKFVRVEKIEHRYAFIRRARLNQRVFRAENEIRERYFIGNVIFRRTKRRNK